MTAPAAATATSTPTPTPAPTPTPIPLLLIGDDCSSRSGMGRILCDIAKRIHQHLPDQFRVATLSLGLGEPSPNHPWSQYHSMVDGYAPVELPWIWREHAQDQHGIIMCITNPSWITWLSHPEQLHPSPLKEFMLQQPRTFQTWLYCPIDGDGPNPGYLPQSIMNIIERFDRRLAYTKWAAKLLDKSRGKKVDEEEATPSLPHGIDTSVFYPRDRQLARDTFVRRLTDQEVLLPDNSLLIGIIATNSPRKDLFVALETCKALRQRGVDIRVWCHTNLLVSAFNLPELVEEFRLDGVTLLSTRNLSDDDMAWCYSACDVTLAPGSEGWGIPISESMACSVPVVHMTYAGGAEFSPKELQVTPIAFRGEGPWGILRPVFDPSDWADKVILARGMKIELPEYIKWDSCWEKWSDWLIEGVK